MAAHGGGNAEVLEQYATGASVLGKHRINTFEYLDGTGCHIVEVPYRCGYYVKFAGHLVELLTLEMVTHDVHEVLNDFVLAVPIQLAIEIEFGIAVTSHDLDVLDSGVHRVGASGK